MSTSAEVEDIYELSPLQQVMLFQTVFAPGSGVYLEQVGFTLNWPLNVPAFSRAWQRVVDHYPALRTSFHWEDLEKPVQVVHRHVDLPFAEHDVSTNSPSDQQKIIDAYLQMDRQQGFELTEAPLVRLACFRLRQDSFTLVWTFHHILLDGWSVQLIVKNVSELYDAFWRGRDLQLSASRPYGDYIAWLQEQSEVEAQAYWRQALEGFTAPTRFNVDQVRNSGIESTDEFGEQEIRVPQVITTALQALARQNQVTLNTVVQGAWSILLSRYSTDADVLFGAIVSGRPAALRGVETMVGLFINTLPVRVGVSPGARLWPWLRELHSQQAASRDLEWSNLVQIQGWSEVPRGIPLFESVLVFENFPMAGPQAARPSSSRGERLIQRTNLPLTVYIVPGDDMLVRVLYDCERFDSASITRLLRHLRTILERMTTPGICRLAELDPLTSSERTQITIEWNTTARDYEQRGVAQLFEEQVHLRPDAVAFVSGGETLTYGELNAQANRLAHLLRGAGVGPERIVGICLERSFGFAVAVLAVFKAGGAYLPLDESYPRERLRFMVADSGATVLITDSRHIQLFGDYAGTSVQLDADRNRIELQSDQFAAFEADANRLAYVIYTSGSTGKPKGVEVEQKQVLNRFEWMWEAYPFASGDVGAQKTALSFVDSIWEWFGPLLRGVPTAIFPDSIARDPFSLVEALAEAKATRIWVVPTLLRTLLEIYPDLEGRLPLLRFWVTSGEALPAELSDTFRRQMPRSALHNLYGTSEVWDATWFDPRREPSTRLKMPIGRPISNVQAYVVDRQFQLAPIGVPGELCIGGLGLGRGYRNRRALTAERFVPNPFSSQSGSRLYRTGDLARFLPDGNIEFLGRLDHQIKIRGFRIEPAEVEQALTRFPGITSAVVMGQQGVDGDARLVAYVIDGGTVTVGAELRTFLQSQLPEYMVPESVVHIDDLPLTPSGKIDRAALSTFNRDGVRATRAFVPPRTPVEAIVARMYAEVLGVEKVSADDHFFADLGGHSLRATLLVSRVREEFEIEMPLREFFDWPTVALLAQRIDLMKAGGTTRLAPITRLPREKHRISMSEQNTAE